MSALREATNTARPGDLIKVAAGAYRLSQQWWIEAKGTVANPILRRCRWSTRIGQFHGYRRGGD